MYLILVIIFDYVNICLLSPVPNQLSLFTKKKSTLSLSLFLSKNSFWFVYYNLLSIFVSMPCHSYDVDKWCSRSDLGLVLLSLLLFWSYIIIIIIILKLFQRKTRKTESPFISQLVGKYIILYIRYERFFYFFWWNCFYLYNGTVMISSLFEVGVFNFLMAYTVNFCRFCST